MHTVQRTATPDFLRDLQAKHNSYDDLCGKERKDIRDALAGDFGPICAYCERPCSSPTDTADTPGEETNDHFKPQEHFPHLSLEWLNLVYSCYRCNQRKGMQWPGYQDELVNQYFATAYADRYVCPKEYVNPGKQYGEYTANELFSFDIDTGKIKPADHLAPEMWSMARRTISDIDLNDNSMCLCKCCCQAGAPNGTEDCCRDRPRCCCKDSSKCNCKDRSHISPGENDPNHLWNRRRAQLSFMISQLNQEDDIAKIFNIIQQFSMPDKPFSGFITAYFKQLTDRHQ